MILIYVKLFKLSMKMFLVIFENFIIFVVIENVLMIFKLVL